MYSPAATRMPDKMGSMRSLVWSRAVKKPAIAPAAVPASRASTGCPAMVTAAHTVMPKTKLPSTVRSGVFKMRKVTNTPRAIGAYSIPWLRAEMSILK